MDNTGERLQKVLAAAGIASRRASEGLITAGRVQVNGRVVTELGVKVNPATDDIRVDDVPIPKTTVLTYIILNKPVGVFSTVSDEKGRKTVLDLVPSSERLYPVGRLDANSEGLILLTNDGELTNQLTHPRYGHQREYRALVLGHPTEVQLNKLRRGVVLEDGPTGPAVVEIVGETRCHKEKLPLPDRDRFWVKIVIGEGRKHQVRRMCEIIGHPAIRLIRVGMGPLRLGSLPTGKYRALTDEEVAKLKSPGPSASKKSGKGRRRPSRTTPPDAGRSSMQKTSGSSSYRGRKPKTK